MSFQNGSNWIFNKKFERAKYFEPELNFQHL